MGTQRQPLHFSPRQAEIIPLLERGLSYKEIAAALCISLSSVKSHVGKILLKTGAKSRAEAVFKTRQKSAV